MAEQYDLEAAVRFYAAGEQEVSAALKKVRDDLDNLVAAQKISKQEANELATAATKYAKALKEANTTAAVKQLKDFNSTAREQQNIYNDYLASQKEGIAAKKAEASATAKQTKEEKEFLAAVAASHARNENRRRQDVVRDRELQAAAIQKATEAEKKNSAATADSTDNIVRQRYAL